MCSTDPHMSQPLYVICRKSVSMKTDSSFSVTTRGRDGKSRTSDSISARGNTLLSSPNNSDRQRPIPPPTQEYREQEPWGKTARVWNWPPHSISCTDRIWHLMQMLRKTKAMPLPRHPTPPYAFRRNTGVIFFLNPLNPELNPICYFLALLGAHHFLHVSRIRVKLLTIRLLMSYIYGAPILDVSRSHTTTQHSR